MANDNDKFNILERWETTALVLGLSKDYFLKVLEPRDDWAFIISATAFVEVALHHGIGKLVPAPVAEFIERASLTAKGELALRLDLLDEETIREFRELIRIRNKFVAHNPEGFKFSLEQHLEKPEERARFAEAFRDAWNALPLAERRAYTLERPALTVRVSTLRIATAAAGIMSD